MKAFKTLITFILIAGVVCAGVMLELKLNEYRVAEDYHTKTVMRMRKGRDVNFKKLEEQNPDTKGWIWLPGTRVDYPIVQGKDNNYYLHRNFDGTYLYDGCIFIDSMVDVPFAKEENTVIYGHRMSSGAMFHDLRKYEDKDFFDENRTIVLETRAGSYDLHVIAFCKEYDDSDLYTVSFAEKDPFGEEFISDEFTPEEPDGVTKADFIALIKEKAVHLSDEPFDGRDAYVTLSTCANPTGDERNQVICIIKNASIEEHTIKETVNKPFINKWLIAQIITAAVMLGIIAIAIWPKKNAKTN